MGRLISSDGYRPDPVDTVALEKFRSPPKTVGELRSLLGKLRGKMGQRYDSKEVIQWTDTHHAILDDKINYLKSP